MDLLLRLAPLAISVLNLLGYGLMWLASQTLVSKAAFIELEGRVNQVQNTCASCKAGFSELNDAVQKASQCMARLDERLNGFRELITRAEYTLGQLQQMMLAKGTQRD